VRVSFTPSLVPARELLQLSLRERLGRIFHVLPVLALLLTVLGGIYTGFTTPTEAAAIGALGAMVLASAYRGLSARIFHEALLSTVKTTCMVIFIIIGAQVLSTGLSYSGITRGMSEWIVSLEFSKWMLFLALLLLYVLLGFFVDGISMIYITLPVLFPVIVAAGFDVIWFGVVLTILIELGQITPPVGLNLFTIQGISGGRPFSEVVIGSTPFVFLMLLTILILSFLPQVALWLPSLM
jgi:tripartite ATP-independent transporter DctM subunit